MTTALAPHTNPMTNNTRWWERAQCAGQDPTLYDCPLPPTTSAAAREQYAANLCAGCPVMAECAADTLAWGDQGIIRAGVWIPLPGPHAMRSHEAAHRTLKATAGRIAQ